jgi:hypothetical protein
MARNFPTSGDYITASAIPEITGNRTLSVWYNFGTTPGSGFPNRACIISKSDTTANYLWNFHATNTQWIFEFTTGPSTFVGISFNFTPDTGVWHHLFISTDNSTAGTLFLLDGVSQTVGGTGGTPNGSGTGGSRQFACQVPGNDPLVGKMADLAIWNVKLTLLEGQALAKGIRPPAVRPLSLQMYFPLDGLQSPEPDLSGNKASGTLTGSSLTFGPPFTMFTPRWPMGAVLPMPIPQFILMPQIVM